MKKMLVTPLVLLSLGLAGGAALAQAAPPADPPAPGPRINRNPEFRRNLPPAPPVTQDPRDSTTRPVQPAEQPPADGRSVVLPQPGPQAPASAPALPASGAPGR
ncbi:hypothetical protein [Polaromonas sp. YR568]|uniref:hypothetical protein n=1 Tax=Polaromonas sp. YR568 TaxID=1855301 RepID=UPI003137BEA0